MNETKEHIIKTSLLLFLQKSYKDVTMKEIVRKTGLSKGAFYHYFESKEELFKEIVTMIFSMGVIDYSKFPQDSLFTFYNHYLKHIDESFKELYGLFGSTEEKGISFNIFLIMFEAMGKFPEFLEMEEEQYKHGLKAWEKVIKNAKEQKEIKSISSNKQLADLFLYSTDGVFIRFLNNNQGMNYKDGLSDSFNTIYNNLKNHNKSK